MTFHSKTDSATTHPVQPGTEHLHDRLGASELLRPISRRLPLGRYSGLLLGIAFIVFFWAVRPDTFPTKATATSIAGDQSIALILALGLLVTLAVGQFDLSAAQNLGMCAMVCSVLMVNEHLSPVVAVLLTLIVASVVGLLNAAFVAIIGVSSIVATLGMSSVLLAVTEQISNFQFVGPVSHGFGNIANQGVFGFPIVSIYTVGLCLLVWYALEHTPVGRRAYAVGANADAARLAGVRTVWYVAGSFVVTAVFAGIGGVFAAAEIGNVAPTLGPAYLLPSFAACFLGTTQVKPGRFNVWGTVIALLLLAIGVKGLQLMGYQLWVTDLFNGLALLVAVSAAALGSKRVPKRKRQLNRAESTDAA